MKVLDCMSVIMSRVRENKFEIKNVIKDDFGDGVTVTFTVEGFKKPLELTCKRHWTGQYYGLTVVCRSYVKIPSFFWYNKVYSYGTKNWSDSGICVLNIIWDIIEFLLADYKKWSKYWS